MSITRVEYGEFFYYVNSFGLVSRRREQYRVLDDCLYRKKNYFLEFETALEFAYIYKKALNDFWDKKGE